MAHGLLPVLSSCGAREIISHLPPRRDCVSFTELHHTPHFLPTMSSQQVFAGSAMRDVWSSGGVGKSDVKLGAATFLRGKMVLRILTQLVNRSSATWDCEILSVSISVTRANRIWSVAFNFFGCLESWSL